MAIFDDPKKQLDWMVQELLAQERPEEPVLEDLAEETQEDDDLMKRVDALIGDVPQKSRNTSADFTRMVHAQEPGSAGKNSRAVKAVKAQKAVPEVNSNIKGLVFLAILETLGILAIIGWWLRWLL